MKKLLKFFTAAMFACLLSVCFIACGKKDDNADSQQSSNTSISENSASAENSESGAGEHNCAFGDWYETRAAKCEEAGEERRDCDCGEFETREIKALTHSYTLYIANGDATCETDGTKTASCDNGCGLTDSLPDEGSALGHSYTVYESNGDATCTEDGTKTATCDNGCGLTDILPDEGSAKGHKFVDGACTECGTLKASEGLEYALNDDGESYAVVGIGTCKDGKIVVPSVYKEKPVTVIGERAFYAIKTFAMIVLPETLIHICDYAFYNCDGLGTFEIPDSVTTIGSRAFAQCDFKEVKLGSGITEIKSGAFDYCTRMLRVYIKDLTAWCKINFEGGGSRSEYSSNPLSADNVTKVYLNDELITNLVIPNDVTSICDAAFFGFYGFETVTIGNSVKCIGNNVFASNQKTQKVEISQSVERIGKQAFSGCMNLRTIIMSDNVIEIGESAFSACSSLTSISIPKKLTVIAKFAFSSCSSLLEIEIPDEVKNIEAFAFSDCTRLTKVVLSNSITTIGAYAFKNCSNLVAVTLPLSLETIGDSAFLNCYKLIEICNKSTLSLVAGESMYGGVAVYAKNVYVEATDSKISEQEGYIIYDEGEETILVGYIGTEKDLILPSGIDKISDYAFYYSDITSVLIPSSVKKIGKLAFFDYLLKTVYYEGSISEWGQLVIGEGNSYLANATLYTYSVSQPSEGNFWYYDENGEIAVW